jgi:membrane-bound lytic murein transglycosylase D
MRMCRRQLSRPRIAGSIVRASRAGAALLLLTLALLAAPAASRADDNPFPRPRVLEPAIAFWRDIFAKYSEHQVVVHDDWYLGKVYEVLDFRPWVEDGQPLTQPQLNEKKRQVDEAEARVRGILLRLDENGGSAEGLGPDERKVAKMFADVQGEDKFRLAAERIRTQAGLRERFALGIARQRPYLSRMERIFGEDGMPPQLARLPLIESCFNVNAYSKVGAAGVWQFMPSTGRQYMTVSDAVDERKDPLRATRAAARHLMGDYDALGEWPLAITAYNHGRGGVARGTEEVSSIDIGDVVMGYRGKAFGFASRNFYAEFLAALDVSSRADELFGELPHMPAVEGEEVELPHPMGIHQAASLAGVSREDLIVANPALLSSVTDGRAYMPRGYRLRVPSGGDCVQVANAEPPPRVERVQVASRSRSTRTISTASAKSRRGVAKVSASAQVRTASSKKSSTVVHQVKPGQTLGGIARQYGTTVEAIRETNKVGKSVQTGQRLRIRS